MDRTPDHNLRIRIGIAYVAYGTTHSVWHEAVFYRTGAATIDLRYAEGDLVTITGRPEYQTWLDGDGHPCQSACC